MIHIYYQYTQEELRSICRNSIEAFEVWARRIIHSKLIAEYGDNYFEACNDNGEKVLNKKHYQKYDNIIKNNSTRCTRPVDALFLESLIYVLCKQNLYEKLFKKVFAYSYPQGVNELQEFLNRLTAPRTSLAHANPISIRQAVDRVQ